HGEVWRVDLEPVRGHEQGRMRPALVMSNDIFNHGPIGLVTIIPITSKARPIRTFLRVDPPQGGLTQISYIICDQVRTVADERLGEAQPAPIGSDIDAPDAGGMAGFEVLCAIDAVHPNNRFAGDGDEDRFVAGTVVARGAAAPFVDGVI